MSVRVSGAVLLLSCLMCGSGQLNGDDRGDDGDAEGVLQVIRSNPDLEEVGKRQERYLKRHVIIPYFSSPSCWSWRASTGRSCPGR